MDTFGGLFTRPMCIPARTHCSQAAPKPCPLFFSFVPKLFLICNWCYCWHLALVACILAFNMVLFCCWNIQCRLIGVADANCCSGSALSCIKLCLVCMCSLTIDDFNLLLPDGSFLHALFVLHVSSEWIGVEPNTWFSVDSGKSVEFSQAGFAATFVVASTQWAFSLSAHR